MQTPQATAPDLTRFHSVPRAVRRRRGARARVLALRLVLVPLVLLGGYCVLVIAAQLSWCLAGTDYAAVVDSVPNQTKAANQALDYHYVLDGSTRYGRALVGSRELRLIAASTPPTLRVRAVRLGPWVYDAVVKATDSPWDVALPALFVALLGVLLGMGSGYFAFVLPTRRRALYETGVAAPGRILRKIQRVQGKTIALSLTYEFSPSTGPEQTGVLSVWRRTYARATEGEAVVILYDPGNPELNVVYEYGDYELAP